MKTYFTGVKRWVISQVGRLSEAAYLGKYRKFASDDMDRLEDWMAVKAATRYWEDDLPLEEGRFLLRCGGLIP
jgi:hypothetical protein